MRRSLACRHCEGVRALIGVRGLVVACALAAGIISAQEAPRVQLSGNGSVVLGPDDTLELVIHTQRQDPAEDTPEIHAWLLASDQQAPNADQATSGRALAVASATRAGDWLVHLRGLRPPAGQERAAWDLFLRWKSGAYEGETRLRDALSFRRGLPDVVLLLDGSLSMGRTDPKRLRVEAARAFSTIARDSGGIGRVALVQFDDNVRTILPLTPLTDGAAFAQALEQIGENGQTDIDGGLRRAQDILRGDAKQASGAIILLTDGKQEPGEYKNAHKLAQAEGVTVHAVALGRDADRVLLKRIASETGGTFSEAGRDQDLLRLYAAIAGKIAGGRTIFSTPLKAAAMHPFPIDGSCRTLAVSVASPEGGDLRLTDPGGESLASGTLPHPLLFRMEPALGTWSAAWTPNGMSAARLEASAQTQLYPVFFRANADATGVVEIDPDDPRVALSLCEGARTLAQSDVSVRIECADGQTVEAQLFDDGAHGDGASGDGVYAGEIPGLRDTKLPADASGAILAVIAGNRSEGEPYRREVRANWQVHRSGIRGLWTSGSVDFGAPWSGSAASAKVQLRVRGQGGGIAYTFLPPNEGQDLSAHLEIVEAPNALAAGARGQIDLRLNIPEGTRSGACKGTIKLTLAATARDPAAVVNVPWTAQVRAAELQILPARLDLGELAPGARESRAIRVSTRGGTLSLAPTKLQDAFPFLKQRDPRWTLLPQELPQARRALCVQANLHTLARIDEAPSDLGLDIEVPEHATAGRWVQCVELRDRFGDVLARLPIELHVRARHLRLPDVLDAGALEPGDEVELACLTAIEGAPKNDLDPRLALRARVTADHVERAEADWRDAEGHETSRLHLRILPHAPHGQTGGWIELDAGAALAVRRWQAGVVPPSLASDVAELDLGALLPGQTRAKAFHVRFEGARATALDIRVLEAPCKPKLRHIALTADCLAATCVRTSLRPGEAAEVEVNLRVPDGAQDGLYETTIVLDSRLAPVEIPVRFRVAAPVAHPPFHVTPAEVTLTVVDGTPAEPEAIVVTSHADEGLLIATRVEPASGYTRGCADLLIAKDAKPQSSAAVVLPGRGETRMLLRAWPDAQDGERCRLILEGAGERQAVDITLKVTKGTSTATSGRDNGESFFDWLRLLFLLLLVLLILLIRALSKKRWVRYATYAIAFHAALMLLAVPANNLVGALPASMQLSLLTTQEDMGFALSPEQERRLEALRTGAEAPEGAQAPKQAGAIASGKDAELPAAEAQAAAPSAEGQLAKAQMEDPRTASAAPDAPRRVEHNADPDQALTAEELKPDRPRAPEPAPEAPKTADDPADAPLALQEPSPPTDLPAQELHPENVPAPAARAMIARAAPTPQARAIPISADAPAPERPTRDAPALDDLPLVAEPLNTPKAPASRKPTQMPGISARTEPAETFAESALANDVKLDAGGRLHTALAAPRGASQAAGMTALKSGQSHGSGGAGQGFSQSGGGQRHAPGLASGDAQDGQLDAGSVAAATSPGKGTNGSKDTGGRDAEGSGPSSPRGLPGGLALSGTGKGSKGNGNGSEGLGSGENMGAQSGATGKLATLGNGHGMGGAERLAEGGKNGLGRGEGKTDGDAPLAAGDLGKVAGRKGQRAGEGQEKPGQGEGRAHAAGAGLGAMGEGPGAGKDGLATLGGSGAGGAKLGSAGKSGSPAKGFELDPYAPGIPSRARLSGRGMGLSGERPVWGPATGNMLRITLGLARHSGDWNSSPTALYHLATAFMERSGLPDVKAEVKNVALSDPDALATCRVILITSNDPIAFTPAERAGLRAYLEKGGVAWVNDSSASGDERFDTAFRRDLETIVPGTRLMRMDKTDTFFRSAYDLSRGYKGYRIPPGDKYREEFVEALTIDKATRPSLIYTRNDYADGLEIDPRNIAGRASLTDLTPDEMLEGSLRFGINLIAFSLGAEAPRLPPPPESSAQAAKLYRYSGPDLPVFDAFEPGADGVSDWSVEDWGNPAGAEHVNMDKGRALKVNFKGGTKSKAAVARNVDLDLSDAKALVLDLHSSLAHGFNVAVLLQTRPDWDGYECRPVFVRPGWNKNLRFPLNLDDFKSSKNDWKAYDKPFALRTSVARITILLYNLESDGSTMLDNLRIEK